jgi:hypothetical protein
MAVNSLVKDASLRVPSGRTAGVSGSDTLDAQNTVSDGAPHVYLSQTTDPLVKRFSSVDSGSLNQNRTELRLP